MGLARALGVALLAVLVGAPVLIAAGASAGRPELGPAAASSMMTQMSTPTPTATPVTKTLPVNAAVSVSSDLGAETVNLQGTVVIEKGAPYLEGGLQVVDAEIVSLQLAGDSVTGPVTVTENPDIASTGQIRSLQPSQQFPAENFFDVFMRIYSPISGRNPYLYNADPIRIVPMDAPFGSEIPIDEWPPLGVTYQSTNTGCVPLLPALPSHACILAGGVFLSMSSEPLPTPTPTVTATATPRPVGGIAEPSDLAAAPLGAPGPSGPDIGLLAALIAGVTAGALALATAVWYAGRRRLR